MEISYCNKATTYIEYLGLAFVALGIMGNLLNMKFGLGSTSWLLLAIVGGVFSTGPRLYMMMARHLLGVEVIKRSQV